MEDSTGVIKNGMYISMKKEDFRIIENDMQLFRSNPEAGKKHYQFTANKFLNHVFLTMCYGQKIEIVPSEKSRDRSTTGINIKINNEIIARMENAGIYSKKAIPPDLSAYYKHFISEYCQLTLTEREQIFYKTLIEELNDAVKLNLVLKIRKNHSSDVTMLPYGLKTADENRLHYVVGFVLKPANQKYIYRKLICVPIRNILPYSKEKNFERIDEIIPQKQIIFSEKSEIKSYKEMTEYMKQRLYFDGVLYLSNNLKTVTVKLTDNGINMLYTRNQFKPKNIIFDNDNQNIIHFQATQLQTFLYFFKFGREAEILKPAEYRKYFLEQYEISLQIYKNNPNY